MIYDYKVVKIYQIKTGMKFFTFAYDSIWVLI